MMWWCSNNRNKLTFHLYLSPNFSSEENFRCPWHAEYRGHYQILLCLADFCLKVFGLVMVCVAVCGAQAAEEGGRKLETSGLLLLFWRWFLLPHHLAIWLWTQHTQFRAGEWPESLHIFATWQIRHMWNGSWVFKVKGCLQTVPGKAQEGLFMNKVCAHVWEGIWWTYHRHMLQPFSRGHQGKAFHSRLLLPSRNPHLKSQNKFNTYFLSVLTRPVV